MKLKDFILILLVGLVLGTLLSLAGPGTWWMGFLAYSILAVLGLFAIVAAYHLTGGGRTLAWILVLAFALRLGFGLATYVFLPQLGYGTDTEKAGYLFFDAFRRDSQAWDLAQSQNPLTDAYDQKMYSDQYGGLLFTSALLYRFLSPDAHRPLLIILLAAWMNVLGIVFVWAAAKRTTNDEVAHLSAWIFALYPEAVLQSSSQMREPFLMTFIAIAFYGVLEWQHTRGRISWVWIGLALVGMLFISPGFALLTIVALAGWVYFSGEGRRIPWQVLAAGAAVFCIALLALTVSWNGLVAAKGGGVIGVLGDWARETAKFNANTLKRSSGIVQLLFAVFPAPLQLPFVAVYGVLQPVLPAILFDTAVPFWQILGILRAVGWYILLPFLVFAPISFWKMQSGQRRAPWIWLSAVVWVWILIASVRGGGDQWDNPRYRVVLLAWQAIMAAQVWFRLRQNWDRWFGKILAVEFILLLVFGHWYLYRYMHIGFNIGVRNSLFLAAGLSVLVFVGDWLLLRRKRA